MPVCPNHPTVEGTRVCLGCKKSFCDDCVVDLMGNTYCGVCKNRAVRSVQQTVDFNLPKEALKYAVVGIFCFGIILEPIAIVKGFQALSQIKANPSLPGKGMALTAIIMGFVLLGGWVLQIALMMTGNLK